MYKQLTGRYPSLLETDNKQPVNIHLIRFLFNIIIFVYVSPGVCIVFFRYIEHISLTITYL